MKVRTTYKSYGLDNGITKKGMVNMKKRTVLTMILAVTIISGILSGCGEKKASAKEPSTKAEQLSITDNNKKKESATDSVTINVLVDNGWNGDSTPAILHVTSDKVDFCHAITPDAEGGKGSTTVALENGTYTVEFISPLNHDGSAYEIFDMGSAQEITVEYGKDMVIDCEMTQIPADQVTDEMIQDIVKKTRDAIVKGDDTLKGDAGQNALDKLVENVQNSPNASEETKDMADSVKDNTEVKAPEVDNSVVENNNSQNNDNVVENNNSQNNNNVQTDNNVVDNNNVQNNNVVENNNVQTPAAPVETPVETPVEKPSEPVESKPEASTHTHTWADHTVTTNEWVANLVEVPDYETTEIGVWVCNCGAVIDLSDPSSIYPGLSAVEDHAIAHIEAGEPDNGHTEIRTTQVQVGSHTEDQGHYESKTTVDYKYCTGCGAKQ